jgi:regulator of sigma E protease
LPAQRPTTLEVGTVEHGTPAAGALKPGDQIVSVDGAHPTNGGSQPSTGDLTDRADAIAKQVNNHTCAGGAKNDCHATTPATFIVKRDGELVTVPITPYYDANAPAISGDGTGRYRVGFGFQEGGFVDENLSVPGAAGRAVSVMWDVTSERSDPRPPVRARERKQGPGVVGVSDVAHQTINENARDVFLLAIVSLSLAIITSSCSYRSTGPHLLSLVRRCGAAVPFSVIERASAIGFLLILLQYLIGPNNDINCLTKGSRSGSGACRRR